MNGYSAYLDSELIRVSALTGILNQSANIDPDVKTKSLIICAGLIHHWKKFFQIWGKMGAGHHSQRRQSVIKVHPLAQR